MPVDIRRLVPKAQFQTPDELRTYLLTEGMGDRTEIMQETWGSGYRDLVNYLSIASAPMGHGIRLLMQEIEERPTARTMIIGGERCSGEQENGSDNPVLVACALAAIMFAPYSALGLSEKLNGREANALSVFFSGGSRGQEAYGEFTGDILASQFKKLTEGNFDLVTDFDCAARNTGDQGRILGGLLYSRRVERVLFCLPLDHNPRFAATVMQGLNDIVQGLRAQQGESLDYRMPEVFFLSHGEWRLLDPRRRATRRQEAFGPVQTPEQAVRPNKLLGDEMGAKRYFAEQNPSQNQGYACGALSPRAMLELIPRWVRDLSLPTSH